MNTNEPVTGAQTETPVAPAEQGQAEVSVSLEPSAQGQGEADADVGFEVSIDAWTPEAGTEPAAGAETQVLARLSSKLGIEAQSLEELEQAVAERMAAAQQVMLPEGLVYAKTEGERLLLDALREGKDVSGLVAKLRSADSISFAEGMKGIYLAGEGAYVPEAQREQDFEDWLEETYPGLDLSNPSGRTGAKAQAAVAQYKKQLQAEAAELQKALELPVAGTAAAGPSAEEAREYAEAYAAELAALPQKLQGFALKGPDGRVLLKVEPKDLYGDVDVKQFASLNEFFEKQVYADPKGGLQALVESWQLRKNLPAFTQALFKEGVEIGRKQALASVGQKMNAKPTNVTLPAPTVKGDEAFYQNAGQALKQRMAELGIRM